MLDSVGKKSAFKSHLIILREGQDKVKTLKAFEVKQTSKSEDCIVIKIGWHQQHWLIEVHRAMPQNS